MRRILRGWNGLDRYTSVLEHGGADDVSIVAASPSAIHVPAGIAGRNGAGQRALGSAGHASGCSDGAHVLLLCADPRTFYNPAAPAYYAATRNGAGGGSRLIGKFVIASFVKETWHEENVRCFADVAGLHWIRHRAGARKTAGTSHDPAGSRSSGQEH